MKKGAFGFFLSLLLTGLSGISAVAQSTLIHYWNFNNPANAAIAVHLPAIYPVHADFSTIDTSKAKIVYQPYTPVSASYASYLDFSSTAVTDSDIYNLRNGDAGGNAIRFRNPSDSMEALFYIPTTNYKDIVLKFVAQASSASNGAKNQFFDYSVDSGATWKTTGLSILKDSVKTYFSLVTVTFDTTANNKRGLVFRMKFGPANTGTSGNDRIDNVTVDADTLFVAPPPPPPSTLIHYWNFNSYTSALDFFPAILPIKADYSLISVNKAQIAYVGLPGLSTTSPAYTMNTEMDTNLTTDLLNAGMNARFGDPVGKSNRVTNPSDSMQLLFYIPSTGYKNLLFKFISYPSSTSSGQKVQLYDYSIDSGAHWVTTGLNRTSDTFLAKIWRLDSFTFDTSAFNKSGLVFRVRFSIQTTGASGNNRFDNVTLDGDPISTTPPTVNIPANQLVCSGSLTAPVTFSSTVSGTTYRWTNKTTSIGLAASGTGNIAAFTATNTGTTPIIDTITVTPAANGLTGASQAFTITVNPNTTVTPPSNQVVGNGNSTTAVNFAGGITGTVYNWTNNLTSIGLAASGSGNIAVFTAVNTGSSPVTATVMVTPTANTCPGAVATFTITVNPTTASPTGLIHYWHFNSLLTAYHNPGIPAIKADYSVLSPNNAEIDYVLSPGASSTYAGYIDNVAGDTLNARMSAPAGQALRVRNPSDSMSLNFKIPTTGYKNIVIKYALQSSSLTSGMLAELFDYSTDNGATWKTAGLSMTIDSVTQPQFQQAAAFGGPVSINFGTDTAVNNNANLIFRIKFAGNTSMTSGNNRFDNVTVESVASIDTSHPNAVTSVSSQANSFTVYPNPAATMVNIATGFDGAKCIAIYNMAGQRVYYNEYAGNMLTINVAGMEAGMYLVQVLDNSTHIVHINRFVKQ